MFIILIIGPRGIEEVLTFDHIGDAAEEYQRLCYVLPDKLVTFSMT